MDGAGIGEEILNGESIVKTADVLVPSDGLNYLMHSGVKKKITGLYLDALLVLYLDASFLNISGSLPLNISQYAWPSFYLGRIVLFVEFS